MESEPILTEARGPIGIITLNRPEKFNTFSTAFAQQLNAALLAFEADDAVRVVVVKGAGKAFSTGIDIAEYPGKTATEYKQWISLMDQMHRTVAEMGKPVIAMVHGYAVANGAGLMAAADFSIVAEGTRIGTTAINVGLLCTGPIIPMSYALGKAKSLEMLLCGEMIDAAEAERLGLVNRVVPADRLEEETLAFAANLAAKSPTAIRLGKRFFYEMLDMPFRQRFSHNAEVFARLCTTEDAKEGIAAFSEKRPAEWKGR